MLSLGPVIAEILAAEEEGAPVDRDAVLARYPELAGELSAFFAAHRAMRDQAANRRGWERKPPTDRRLDAPTCALGAPDAGDTDPDPPRGACRSFGDYELLSEIARGGMGVVYRARHRRLNRVVALKMILSGPLADRSTIRRFQTEAESAARIDHSGIVAVHEIGELDGVHYYTMPLIDGRSLAERLASEPIEPEEAAKLVKKIASAVAHAHSRQVVHRDLKPANILIDENGEPRITDFGLAKRLDDGPELTATGQIVGTLQYMAPEQARGESHRIGKPADIYALGAVLYAMLTGRPPFQAANQMDLWLQVVEIEPIPPRKLNASVPRELQRICLKCLEKDPHRRYATADDVVTDLDAYLRGEPPPIATTSMAATLRRLPRRFPAVCAHLIGLGLADLGRHARFFSQGWETVRSDWRYHFQFTGIMALWALCSLALQPLFDREHGSRRAGFLWATLDVMFLTGLLLLARGPIGPLFSGFALLIVVSVAFFRARLTAYMTIASIIGFLLVVAARPSEAVPPHYAVVFLAVLIVTGIIFGYHIRRMRLMSEYYERRR